MSEIRPESNGEDQRFGLFRLRGGSASSGTTPQSAWLGEVRGSICAPNPLRANHAEAALVKNSARSRPLGRLADFSLMWFLWKAYLAAAWKPSSIWSWRDIPALPGFGNSGVRLVAEACAGPARPAPTSQPEVSNRYDVSSLHSCQRRLVNSFPGASETRKFATWISALWSMSSTSRCTRGRTSNRIS